MKTRRIKNWLKIIAIFSIILIQIQTGYAQNETRKEEEKFDAPKFSFERVIEELGLKRKGLDWGESFIDDPEKVGQDLYVLILNKTAISPNDKSVEALAKSKGIPKGLAKRILGGDISPIIEARQNLTLEQGQLLLREMQAEYEKNLDLIQVEMDVLLATEPNEIFTNGDLGDSGFDLIYDLNLIEEILFLRANKVDIGLQYKDDNVEKVQNNISIGSGLPEGGKTQINFMDDFGVPLGQDKDSGEVVMEDEKKKNEKKEESTKPSTVICYGKEDFNEAILKFEGLKAEDKGKKKDKDTNFEQYDDENNKIDEQISKNADLNDKNKDLPEEQFGNGKWGIFPKPAEESDWSVPDLCGDILCLEFNLVMAPVKPSYNESDDCIACHVEYINLSLEKTLAHSLVPGKVTGNFGEPAKCKNALAAALGSVSLNFGVRTFPLPTPAKSESIELRNLNEEFNKYLVEATPMNYFKKKKKLLEEKKGISPKESLPIISDFERETQKQIGLAPENISLEQINSKIYQGSAKSEKSVHDAVKTLEIANQSLDKVLAGTTLIDEMEEMNNHFQSFSLILKSLNEQVKGISGPVSCKEFFDKKECK